VSYVVSQGRRRTRGTRYTYEYLTVREREKKLSKPFSLPFWTFQGKFLISKQFFKIPFPMEWEAGKG